MSIAPTTPSAYSRAPIVEAVVGIVFAQAVTEKALAAIDRRFGKHYPEHQDNVTFSIAFNQSMGPVTHLVNSVHQEAIKGHKRTNAAMDEVALLMPDAFAVSQLAPYPGWAAFGARVQRDWALYKRSGTYRAISRIGMRYINRIDIAITGPVVEHEQYMDLYPRVPDALGAIVGYSMQTVFKLESIGGQATLNTAAVPSPILGHASFLVDIDVYKTTNLPMNDADVFSLLEQMRLEKNRIFEACVTQRAREEIFGYANT